MAAALTTIVDVLVARGWQPPRHEGATTVVDYPDDARDPLDAIEGTSPWFSVRNQVIDAMVARAGRPSALVEVGAGNGTVAAHLRTTGIDVLAVEPAAAGAENCRRRGLATMNATLEALDFPESSLPAIGVFDVLEHLADPEPLVREAHRTIRPGGLFVVTVPALPLLWSQADEFAGHQRRYRRATLDALVVPTGFERVVCSYFFMLGAPFSFVQRALPFRLGHRRSHDEMLRVSLDELDPPGRIAPAVIRLAGAFESRSVAHRVRLPVGTSLGAVYRKA